MMLPIRWPRSAVAHVIARRELPWLLAIAGITAAVYSRLVTADFTNWDDNRFITGNPIYDQGGIAYVKAAFTTVQFEAYAPFHLLSYLIDRALWPQWAGGFHLLNLAIFVAGVFTWYSLARRLAPAPAAAVAVLVLALHPQTVEPVAWISARKDLLALLFVGLVLLVEDRGEGRRPKAAAVVLGICAYLSKVSTVCLPVLVFAHLHYLRALPPRDAAWRALPHAVGAAALAMGTWIIFHGHSMIPPARPDPAVVDVFGTVAAYVGRTFLPSPSPIYAAAAPAALVGTLLGGAGLLVAAITWPRWPAAGRFAIVAFGAAILPVANVVPVVFRFADRYVLLAHAVLVPPLAMGIKALWGLLDRENRRWRWIFISLFAAILAGETVVTVPVVASWQNSENLWERAARTRPDVLMVRMKNGETLRDVQRFPEAIAEYQAVARLAPDDYRGYLGLFLCYARQFELEKPMPPGTADTWFAELSDAMASLEAFGRLHTKVTTAGCGTCAGTLLALGLRHWPQSPSTLRRLADKSRRAGDETSALIYEDALRRSQ